MSIRHLIVSAIALLFLVSVFVPVFAGAPDVNELEDPSRAKYLARALVSEYRNNPVRFVRDRVGTQFHAHGEVVKIVSDGAVRFRVGFWDRGKTLECRFRDPNTLVLLDRNDKITVRGTVDSVEWLGKYDYVLHMVDCEIDAGG